MHSLTPPAKSARGIQRTPAAASFTPRPLTSRSSIMPRSSTAFNTSMAPSFAGATSTVGHAGVGPSMTWLLEEEKRTVFAWPTSGATALGGAQGKMLKFRVPDADVTFVGEGFDGQSIVTCSENGNVGFVNSSGKTSEFSLFQGDASNTATVVTKFVTVPVQRRIIAILSNGGVVVATFGDDSVSVVATNVSPKGTRSSGTSGNASGWFAGWFGGSTPSGKHQTGGSAEPSDPSNVVEITSLAVGPNDSILVATNTNIVTSLVVGEEELTTEWSASVEQDRAAICSLSVVGAKVVHVLLLSEHSADSRVQTGSVITLDLEDGQKKNKAPISIPTPQNTAGSDACDRHPILVSTCTESVGIVSLRTRMIVWAPLVATARSNRSFSTANFDSEVFAAGVTEFGATVCLTAKGPCVMTAPASNGDVSAEEIQSGDVLSQIMASVAGDRVSLDDACLQAADDIIGDVKINPANWARGDLDADDINILTYVTNSLTSRQDRHRSLVKSIMQETDVVEKLKPSTVGELLSQQERLVVLAAIRNLQNAATGNAQLDTDLKNMIKSAIVDVAAMLKQQATGTNIPDNASSAEIVFMQDTNVNFLLTALNHYHQMLGVSESPLEKRLNEAHAISSVFGSVCEAIESSRQELTHQNDDQKQFLWTSIVMQQEGEWTLEALLDEQTKLAGDTLALSIDIRNKSSATTTSSGTNVLDHLESEILKMLRTVTEFLFRHHPQGSLENFSSSLRRSMFRRPFFENELGYPFGNPVVFEKFNLCHELAEAVQQIAITHNVFSVLCDFSLASHVANPRESHGSYSTFRNLCEKSNGLFEYALGWLLNQKREQEVELLHVIAPDVPDAEAKRDFFLANSAPHLHWVINKKAYQSLIAASKGSVRISESASIMDNRQANLALAKLGWVAQGRPSARKTVMEQDLKVVKIQREFMPDTDEKVMDSTSLAGALVGAYGRNPEDEKAQDGLVASAKLADTITKGEIQLPLLSECIAKSFALDNTEAKIDHIRRGGAAESEMTAQLSELLIARVIDASATLKKALFHPDGGVVKMVLDDKEEYFTVLKSWAKSRYL